MALIPLFIFLLLAPCLAFAQEPEFKAVSESYRLRMKSDAANSRVWALCSAAALARSAQSQGAFREYARKAALSLRQLVPPGSACPCADVIPMDLWQGGPSSLALSDSIPNGQSKHPPVAKSPSSTMAKKPTLALPNHAQQGTTTDVSRHAVPGFVPGKSLLLPTGSLKGSYRSVYVAFMNENSEEIDPSDYNSLKVLTHIQKLRGAWWSESAQERAVSGFDPNKAENEKDQEVSYWWTGMPTVKEAIASHGTAGLAMGKFGYYTKNADGSPSSTSNIRQATLVSICRDNSYSPTIYGIGSAPIDGSNFGAEPYLYISNKGSDANSVHFNSYALGLGEEDLDRIHMAASDKPGDAHVWVAAGTKVIRATASGDLKTTDLRTYGAEGEIGKISSRNGELWLMCGNDIFRVNAEGVKRFYTSKSGLSSFAVDNDYVFTSDGYKTTKRLSKTTPIFGSKPLVASRQAEFDEAKSMMGSCLMETTGDPTDWNLYLFSPSTGMIYRVAKGHH